MTACGCVTSGKVKAYKGTAAKETATWAASSKINVMAMAPTPTATATRFVIPDAFHPPHMWCSAATSYYLAASVRGWMEARPARGQRHMRVSWRRRLFWNVAAGPEGRICTSTDSPALRLPLQFDLRLLLRNLRTHLHGLRRASSSLQTAMCTLENGSTTGEMGVAGASTTQEKSTTASGKMTCVLALAMRQYRETIRTRRATG